MLGKSTTSRRQTVLSLVVVTFLLVSSIGPVLAAPKVYVASASVENRDVVTGDGINVTFELRNGEDSGAKTVTVYANDTEVISNRYQVDSGEVKTVTEQISLDDPGVYQIRVDSKDAGVVRVTQTIVETVAVRPGGRSMRLRGGQISRSTTLTTDFPATNDTVAVESLSYQSFVSGFDLSVETYTNATAVPVSVPEGETTTVFGAVTTESVDGVEDQQLRIGVNQSTVDASPLSEDGVDIYRTEGDNFVQLDTTRSDSADGRYLYQARIGDAETVVIGSLTPDFTVSGHSLSTDKIDGEKRIQVSANVTNSGSIAGNYTASTLVDGTPVASETVTLDPGETRAVTIDHSISQDGTYRVTLDKQFVGVVDIETGGDEQGEPTETQTATETPPGDTATDSADETETETHEQAEATETTTDRSTDRSEPTATETEIEDAETDTSDSGLSLPDPDVGLSEIAIGGGIAVIGVLLVLLQRW